MVLATDEAAITEKKDDATNNGATASVPIEEDTTSAHIRVKEPAQQGSSPVQEEVSTSAPKDIVAAAGQASPGRRAAAVRHHHPMQQPVAHSQYYVQPTQYYDYYYQGSPGGTGTFGAHRSNFKLLQSMPCERAV